MNSNEGISRRKTRSSSRSKENKEISSRNLHEEVIFLILTWIPVDTLYSCMRFVCKQWHEIILSSMFQEQHHPSRSSSLFFAQNNLGYFASFGKSEVLRTELKLPFHYKVRAGCNGLLLLLEHEIDHTLHVANPFTRRITKLPPIVGITFCLTWSFVCVSSTKEYKVVVTYESTPYYSVCVVLTLGKGCTWKVIPHYEDEVIYPCSAFCVRDIVFWVDIDTDAQCLVGFCAESERTFPFPWPNVDSGICRKHYLPGGQFLSLVVQYDKRDIVDIWCLFDPKGVAEWKRMYKIKFGGTISPLNIYYKKLPVILVNKEILVFQDESSLFGHCIKNGKTVIIGESKTLPPVFCCEFDYGFTWMQLKDDNAQS